MRQPLVTTIIGVVVSVVLCVVAYNVVTAARCDPIGGASGRAFCESGAALFVAFPVLMVGVLITGLVVGSHDSGTAVRAVLAGVMVTMLILGVALVPTGIMVVENGDYAGATLGGLASGAVVGLVALIPAALGFGIGHAGSGTGPVSSRAVSACL